MRKLLIQIATGILGLLLASHFVPGVEFLGPWKTLILAGFILGLINFFLKPFLKLITFPLRILSLGFFTLVINMGLIWLVDIFFPELVIVGLIPLFWTSLIIGGLNLVIPLSIPKGKPKMAEI